MSAANAEYLDIAAEYDAAGAVLDNQLNIALAARKVPGLPLEFAAFWPPQTRPSDLVTEIIATLWGSQLQQAAADAGVAPPAVSEMFAMLTPQEAEDWVRDSSDWCRDIARRIRAGDPALKIAIEDYLES